jgi:hypothetical protein
MPHPSRHLQVSPSPAPARGAVAILVACVALGGCDGPTVASRPPCAPVLSIQGAGRGDGRVTSSPAGIDCAVRDGVASGACTLPFDSGSVVTLAATVAEPSEFAGWSGPCAGAASCVLTMAGDHAATATFDGPTLRVLAGAPPSGGTVGAGRGDAIIRFAPGGASCRVVTGALAEPCRVTTRPGELLSMTVEPDSGEAGVIQWGGPSPLPLPCTPFPSGPGVAPGRLACAGALPRSGELRVNVFRRYLSVSRAAGASGSGRVTDRALGIDCVVATALVSGTCGVEVEAGASVSLVYAPDAATLFQGWTGPCAAPATSRTCAFAMQGARQTALVGTRSLLP